MYDDYHSRRAERRAYKEARRAERWQTRHEPLESLDGLTGAELDAAIRRRVERRARERVEFFTHLASYIGVNFLVWAIWFGSSVHSGRFEFPWPLFVTLGWGSGLFAHAFQVYQSSAYGTERREQTMQRAIAQEKMRLGITDDDGTYEKPKRDQLMRLSDEGELVPEDVEDTLPLEKSKNV